MNSYRREKNLTPFVLQRKDVEALWGLLLELLPAGETDHAWQDVSVDLDRVDIRERDVDSLLANPEWPESFASLSIAVHKSINMDGERVVYSLRVSLRRSWATVSADGPDEAWAIGAVEKLSMFFKSRARRFGSLFRAIKSAALPVLGAPAGALLAIGAIAVLEGNRQTALLALVSVSALAILGLSLTLAKGGDVSSIRMTTAPATQWSLTLVMTVIACVFTVLTFIVAVLQLLKSP